MAFVANANAEDKVSEAQEPPVIDYMKYISLEEQEAIAGEQATAYVLNLMRNDELEDAVALESAPVTTTYTAPMYSDPSVAPDPLSSSFSKEALTPGSTQQTASGFIVVGSVTCTIQNHNPHPTTVNGQAVGKAKSSGDCFYTPNGEPLQPAFVDFTITQSLVKVPLWYDGVDEVYVNSHTRRAVPFLYKAHFPQNDSPSNGTQVWGACDGGQAAWTVTAMMSVNPEPGFFYGGGPFAVGAPNTKRFDC
jgi:hypothetical protein